MDRITVYFLTVILISNPCDSGETKNANGNNLGDRLAAGLDTSENEIPSNKHDSALINQYSSPPLCYQVQYTEMAETPKIICGKELQQIYLKFNPGLMKNLFVNIYLTNEDSPITIKPIESLNSIYNDSIAAPYFEPPINPEIASKLSSLEPSSKKAEEYPPPFKAIYYYPEAQKYPGTRDIRTKVLIGTPSSGQLTYEKDDKVYFNQQGRPQSPTEYDPYAYRNIQATSSDQPIDDSKNLPNLWYKILNSNKPLVLNCLISPISCPSNIYPLPLAYFSNHKMENSGISSNSYNVDPNNNVGFEDYDEATSTPQQPLQATKIAPYYNYQDLQKMLLDAKRLKRVNTIQNNYSNLRESPFIPHEKVFNQISPRAYYKPNNFLSNNQNRQYSEYSKSYDNSQNLQYSKYPKSYDNNQNLQYSKYSKSYDNNQNRQYSEYPKSYEYAQQQNLRQPKHVNHYSSVPKGRRPAQSRKFQENGNLMSNSIMVPQANHVGYFANRLQYPASQFTQPQFYPTTHGPLIRQYFKNPMVLPLITQQQLYNEPKFLPNFQVLLGFIQPVQAATDELDKTLNFKPTTQSIVNNSSPTASTVESDLKSGNIKDPSKTTTEADFLNSGDLTTATDSSTIPEAVTLGDTGPEVTSPPEIGNQEEDHVQKKPAALLDDENSESEIQQNNPAIGSEYSDVSAKSFKQDEDDLVSDNILKDYILNLKSRERQYEKVIYQSQRQLEELQRDFEELKKGVGKYSSPSTPYYNYGVNNNNHPLPPLVPIVQHFTSLNNPLLPSSALFYPATSNHPANSQKTGPVTSFSNTFLNPSNAIPGQKSAFYPDFFDTQAQNMENGEIDIDSFNNFRAYLNRELGPRLVYYPYGVGENAYRMPASSDEDFVDYENESDSRSKGIINNNVNVRNNNINSIPAGKPNVKVDNSVNSKGPEPTSEEDETTDSSSIADTETTNSLSTENTETTTDSISTQDAMTTGSSTEVTDSSVNDRSMVISSGDSDENSSDNTEAGSARSAIVEDPSVNTNGKKVKTTIRSKLKFIKEISSNRTIIRDNQDVEETSTEVADSSTPSITSSIMPTDESTISTETTETETDTTNFESTSSPTFPTDDESVGDGRKADQNTTENPVPVTDLTSAATANPLSTSAEKITSPQSQEEGQASEKSAESNPQNAVSSLDPLIEDIVKGIKEKRNYVDDIFQNAINSNIQSKISDSSNKSNSKVEKSARSSVPKDNKFGTLAIVEAPLTIVYYPGYDKDRKLRNKS